MPPNIFIDESGNTGRDIYDLPQPLLTYAGVWLSPTQETAAANELDRLVGIHGLQRQGELKGKTILNSRGGRNVVRDVLRWLRQENVSVTAIAFQKPSMAANVLVEDCTDPAYNDAFDDEWTWNTRLKEPLGEKILRTAPSDLLTKAWRERNGTDKPAFVAAYTALLSALAAHPDDDLRLIAVRMQRTNLDALWDATSGTRGTSAGYSPNLSVFTSLIMNAERHAESRGYESVELVHDEQRQYRSAFEQAWTMIRGDGTEQQRMTLPNGNVLILGLKRLTGFRFADSRANIGIQFADLVVSAIRVALAEHAWNLIDRSRDYTSDLQALLLSQLAVENSPFVIGPESWQLLAMTHLLGRDPRTLRRDR